MPSPGRLDSRMRGESMGEGGRSSSLAVPIHKEDSSRGALVARRLLWGAALNHLALFNPHNKPARWVLSPPFHRFQEMTRLPKRSLADERCLCLQTSSLNHTVVGLKHIHLFRTLQPTKCSHTSSLSVLQTVPWGRCWLRDHSTLEASQATWPEPRH